MSKGSISADILFSACAASDLASLQTLLLQPTYIAKALETESRILDEKLQLTIRRLNLLSMFIKAADSGSSNIIKYLLSFVHTHNVPHSTLIARDAICAAIDGSNNVAVFREFVAVIPDVVNINMGHPGTPLSQAVAGSRNCPRYTADRISLVAFLLDHGADPNQKHGPDNSFPGTILRTAVQRSSLEVVELLIKAGAQIAQSGAMHVAAENGRIDVMELLVGKGAEVDEELYTNLGCSRRYRTRVKKEVGIVSNVSDER
jgi:ankyrin repeat protein